MFSWADTPQGAEFWYEKRGYLLKYLLPRQFDLIKKNKKAILLLWLIIILNLKKNIQKKKLMN